MFCSKCGKQIPDNTKFCPYCGAQNQMYRPPAQNPYGGAGQPSPGRPSPSPKKKSRLPLILGLIVLFLVFFIAAFILFGVFSGNGGSEQPKETLTHISRGSQTGSSEAETPEAEDENSEAAAEAEDETEAAEDEGEEAEEAAFVIPPNTAEDDGNLFGNSHCYARIISDGTYLYFRNELDKERTYWVKKGETEAHPLSDVYMKDLHYKDGWIYYSRTTEGDIAQGTRDNNIYRMKTDGSGNTNLSNLTFDNPQCWLSFETMSNGRCFFVYTNGKGISVDIGYAPESGGSSVILASVPAANVVDNPCINVIGDNVYYLAGDGLHCVSISTQADTVVLPGFSCREYMIYGGVIYFWENASDGHAVLSSVNLDGTGRTELFRSSDSEFSEESMQINIYQGDIYVLLHSGYPDGTKNGRLYQMELDGSKAQEQMDGISWFNIVEDTLYYRLIDTEETPSSASDDSAYYYTPFDSVTEGTGKEDGTGLFHSASSGQSGH